MLISDPLKLEEFIAHNGACCFDRVILPQLSLEVRLRRIEQILYYESRWPLILREAPLTMRLVSGQGRAGHARLGLGSSSHGKLL
jgi:hypothetical protein